MSTAAPGPLPQGPPGPEHQHGDRVEYVAAPVFDGLVRTGDVGVVTSEQDGWVHAEWPRGGVHSVPSGHVRKLERSR
ncbi:hypothetical protein [Auraticoccus monumenti]|uniref:DUF1918 domain-containing protein n=1 Tax=Auraticoccus monumenti TaxID=675864 RepID=A0A1G7A182_9ACTN|nr:hypothetical protein [Auraticoccus monumenti]SDE07656.1 hypothetical protein SAMN04489747_2447 [Auraticoccus monumenti]